MSITLTGTFTRLDGTPATGTVRVTPSRSPIMDPDGKIVISGPQVFPLDANGTLSVPIPASNDPDLGPAFTYTVEALLSHNPWKISKVWIPHGSTTVDLSEIGDYQPVPGVATRVVTIPADGTDGQVLVWDGATFAWEFPPEGPRGPKGDLDAEQLAGAPRLTNLLHDMRWVGSTATIHSQTPRLAEFTAIQPGGFIRWAEFMSAGERYYFTGEVKATSDRVCLEVDQVRAYHSGSGDWERLSGTATPSDSLFFQARDLRSSGWEPIEVRDPVLINLTEVFGAGREPSKEYMDALMEKHGHYIGGVDQFAFGDALKDHTVAGPGLALRHDNSVGERVFLDYPGGSTMIHGDTGWRNVEDLLDPAFVPAAVQGRVRVRRVNNQVFWIIRGRFVEPLPMDTAQNVTTTIPTQFRQSPANYGTLAIGLSFPSRTVFSIENLSSSETLAIRGAETGDWSVDNLLSVSFSYSTTASWPTTLPGTPA